MSVLTFLANNYTIFLVLISVVVIVLFTELSIDRVGIIIALIGVCIVIYKMAVSSTSMLTVGLVGIILVLLFALASGVGNSSRPVIIKEDCKSNKIGIKQKTPPKNCPLSDLDVAGMCPMNYTNYTDGDGNTLCCASSNIDPYSHTCPAQGPNGVCSMAPGLEDRRSPSDEPAFYPLCQSIRNEQVLTKGASSCPRKYPHYLQLVGKFICCGTLPSPTATDCPDPAASCHALWGEQNVLNSPDSCEARKLQDSIICPTGTSLNPKMQITDPKTKKVLYVPSCQGVTNTCYPRRILNKCVENGGCSKLDIDNSISNCEIYTKIFNERSKDLNTVDISPVDFFN